MADVQLPSEAEFSRSMEALCHGCAESGDAACGSGTAVFLDLETTGLSGAGATPFIVGLAHATEPDAEGSGAYVVEQWCLERLSAEREMLSSFVERVAEIAPEHVCSFNGASFDVPLLRRRCVLHGLRDPFEPAAPRHVDLLHVSRRIWRDRFVDCRLGTLEREVLGLRRTGDVPGNLIPEAFWSWLRAPDDPSAQARLAAVRVHNQVDLVALPALAWRIARSLEAPSDLAECLRAARHLLTLGQESRALRLLWPRVQDEDGTDDTRRRAGLLAGDLLRREGRHAEAQQLWERLRRSFPGDPQVHEALAIHLEHRRRDPVEALVVASSSDEPCSRRLERLRGKVARLESPR